MSWGDQTWEEMMIGFYVEVFPKGQMPERPSGGRIWAGSIPSRSSSRWTPTATASSAKDELPGRLAQGFALADADRDGSVSKEELSRLLNLVGGLQRGR